jgi:hypothetical protein
VHSSELGGLCFFTEVTTGSIYKCIDSKISRISLTGPERRHQLGVFQTTVQQGALRHLSRVIPVAGSVVTSEWCGPGRSLHTPYETN